MKVWLLRWRHGSLFGRWYTLALDWCPSDAEQTSIIRSRYPMGGISSLSVTESELIPQSMN